MTAKTYITVPCRSGFDNPECEKDFQVALSNAATAFRCPSCRKVLANSRHLRKLKPKGPQESMIAINPEKLRRGGLNRIGNKSETQLAPAADELKPLLPKRQRVRLVKMPSGEYFLLGRNGESFYKATDYEYSLWMDLEDCRRQLSDANRKIAALETELKKVTYDNR
jgi:ribosomal protein S27E